MTKKTFLNRHDSLLSSSITTLFFLTNQIIYIQIIGWFFFSLSLSLSLSNYFISVSLSYFSLLFCSLPFKSKPMARPLSQATTTHHHHRPLQPTTIIGHATHLTKPNLRLLSVGGSIVGPSSPALSSSLWVSQVCLAWLWFMGCDSFSDGFWLRVWLMFWPWVLSMFSSSTSSSSSSFFFFFS